MTDSLRDRPLEPFVLALTETATPSPDAWTVVVDAGGEPVTALPPGTADEVGHVVVADADLPLDRALNSPAFQEIEPDSPVVLTSAGKVVGVWAGVDLVDTLMRGGSRWLSDNQLPGQIGIPEIRRRCRYVEDSVACRSLLSVPEKPEVMPPCPNERMFSAHTFAW